LQIWRLSGIFSAMRICLVRYTICSCQYESYHSGYGHRPIQPGYNDSQSQVCLTNTKNFSNAVRPEDLVLADDPAFLPGINLSPFNVEALLSEEFDKINRSVTQDTVLSTNKDHSQAGNGDTFSLILPSDNMGDSYGINPTGSMMRAGDAFLDDDFALEAGFAMDDDGNIIDFPSSSAAPFSTNTPAGTRRSDIQRPGATENTHIQLLREYADAEGGVDTYMVRFIPTK
jgi:hypothetical protein